MELLQCHKIIMSFHSQVSCHVCCALFKIVCCKLSFLQSLISDLNVENLWAKQDAALKDLLCKWIIIIVRSIFLHKLINKWYKIQHVFFHTILLALSFRTTRSTPEGNTCLPTHCSAFIITNSNSEGYFFFNNSITTSGAQFCWHQMKLDNNSSAPQLTWTQHQLTYHSVAMNHQVAIS